MKKYTFIFLFCFLSLGVHAEIFSNCIPFTARNGKRFCYRKANNGITWLGALAWCDAQGLRLAPPNELCDIDQQPWNRMIQGNNGCKAVVTPEGTLIDGVESHIYWLGGLLDGGAFITQSIGTTQTNNPIWPRTALCAMD